MHFNELIYKYGFVTNYFFLTLLRTIFSTDKAERLIAEATGYGSQLVVFPEAFIGGYPRGSTFGFGISISIINPKDKGKEAFRRYHAAAIDVPGTWKYYGHFSALLLILLSLLNWLSRHLRC